MAKLKILKHLFNYNYFDYGVRGKIGGSYFINRILIWVS